eukprot:7388760-Prymnesium_polylepis.1
MLRCASTLTLNPKTRVGPYPSREPMSRRPRPSSTASVDMEKQSGVARAQPRAASFADRTRLALLRPELARRLCSEPDGCRGIFQHASAVNVLDHVPNGATPDKSKA